MTGTVTEVTRGALMVQLTTGHMVRAVLGGRLIRNRIKVLPGDEVRLEVSPYDLDRGRVIYRLGPPTGR